MSLCDVPVLGSVICGAAKAVASDVLKPITDAIGGAAADLWKLAAGMWLHVGIPTLDSHVGVLADMGDHIAWLVSVVAVVCILIACGKMALTQSSRPAGDILRALILMILVGAPLIAATNLLGSFFDQFGLWLLGEAVKGQNIDTHLGVLTAGLTALGPGYILLLAPLVFLGSLMMVMLAVVRGAILVILVGAVLPVTAGMAATEGGWHSFRRAFGWWLSWLLLKPAAALITATAMFLVGDSKTALDIIAGIALAMLSVLALPALLRLMESLMNLHGAAAMSGAGGALAGGAAAAATGARMFSGGGGGGSAGGSSAAAPTGAAATGSASAASSGAASGASAGAAAAGPVGIAVVGVTQGVSLVKGAANKGVEGAGGGT